MQEFKVIVLNLWPRVARVFRITEGQKDADVFVHQKLLEMWFMIQE